ncbi:CBS domain-containing protein [Marinactinospora rubrisoli]|uniref:CBS domain-containing protein n=1 Tax=Marinactinospora rubrisoli TaxID=2715399 RepID=A0ABW2KPG3_9ACTN
MTGGTGDRHGAARRRAATGPARAATTVGTLMTRDVVAVSEAAEFREIVTVLRRHLVGALPVVDAERRVAGVVSATDLLVKLADPDPDEGGVFEEHRRRAERRKCRAATARDLMTAPAVTTTAEATPRDAAELMRRHHVGRLPVVDSGGRLVGILGRLDLLRVYTVPDAVLCERVRRALADDVPQDGGGVRVSVHGGEAFLDGRVPRRSDVPRLAHAVRAVEGVVDVWCRLDFDHDDLEIPLPGAGRDLGPSFSTSDYGIVEPRREPPT